MAATMLIYANGSIKGRRYEVKQTFIAGVHRTAFFCFGVGQKEFFWGGAGRGRELLNSGHFRGGVGRGGLENFGGWGGPGQPFYLGPGRSGACIPDLFFFIKAALHK